MTILKDHINDHVSFGCRECSLGIQKMPDGYALMLDADGMYYYWLRSDGAEGHIHWNKWAVYRGAKANAQRGGEGGTPCGG